jgi:hypothetical protein
VLFDVLLDLASEDAVVLFEANRWRFNDESFRYLSSLLVGNLDDRAVIYGGVG